MKKIKYLIISTCLVIIFSALGFFITNAISKISHPLNQISQNLVFANHNYDQTKVNELRFQLLYQNQQLKKVTKQLNLRQETFANNFKIQNCPGENQFTISFASPQIKTNQTIIATVTKIVTSESEKKIIVSGLPQTKKLSQNHFKFGLIGLITGGFIALGIIAKFMGTSRRKPSM
jgi:hypothetical protein